MEKNQYKLCIEVLRRLDTTGVLKDFILIGSWCIPFYKEYFDNVKYNPSIRTRDIDFLVPEKGKGFDKPYPLPQLGLNAQALRFLNLLSENSIQVKAGDISIRLPHPANFSLHKLIIFQRRSKLEKMDKDKNEAIKILRTLINKGELNVIKTVFNSIPKKWQNKAITGLKLVEAEDILEKLIDNS